MAWHPYFNPGTANTRMDYEHPLNRPLFIALFKQTQASSNALSDCRRSVSATLLIAERCCPLCWSLARVLSQRTNCDYVQIYIHNVKHAMYKHNLQKYTSVQSINTSPCACTGYANFLTVQQERIKTAKTRQHEFSRWSCNVRSCSIAFHLDGSR